MANVVFTSTFAAASQAPALKTASHLRVHAIPEDDIATYFFADRIQRNEDGVIHLTGAAQVRRIDAITKGDEISYDSESGQVQVLGQGRLIREGVTIHSDNIHYNLNAETGRLVQPSFVFNKTGGAGTAESAQILSTDHLRLTEVDYSGCPCPERSWYIKAPTIDIHSDKNTGVAKHGKLYFKDVPILYAPYLTFPLREERKSGVLLPSYGYSSNSGFEIDVPYYFNLAPNYDATLTPRYLSKRGLQMKGEFRYLGLRHEGYVSGTYLNKDKEARHKRWLIDAGHSQDLGAGFGFDYNYSWVSDDNYFRDFSTFGLNEASTRELRSQARFTWKSAKYVDAALSVSKYQTLQNQRSSYRRPEYDKLPQLDINGKRYNWNGFDVQSQSSAARFEMPYYSGSLSEFDAYRHTRLAPDSTRISSYNTVAYPVVRPAWYATPKVGLHLSHYNTRWRAVNNAAQRNLRSNVSRVVPMYSMDAGTTFERNTSLFGLESTQTLEPRLYYLYVPHREQNDIPNLDTSVASFNFSQAFSENIYSGGWDRIANANQLTLGLTTRWLDADTGFERVTLQAAQRFHFAKQRVFLSNFSSHEHPPERTRSDYLFGAQAALTDDFTVRADLQINPETRKRNRMSASMRWSPKRLATIAASYRYERDPRAFDNPNYHFNTGDSRTQEQISATAQWPLSEKLYGLGRIDYSLQEKRSTQTILGVEYKGDCCWTGRFVVQRYAVSPQKSNSAVFLQLELTGLGSIGTDPMSLLRDRVVGYESVNPSVSEKTTFERYE